MSESLKQGEITLGTNGNSPEIQTNRKGGAALLFRNRRLLLAILLILLIAGGAGGFLYWRQLQTRIYIEHAEIYAPVIAISGDSTGVLNELYVHEGDTILAEHPLAKIGGHTLRSETGGLIVWVNNVPGQTITPQTVLVKMIEPSSLRVIGHIEEDKGLSDLRPGQNVIFTVDAYGSKQYLGRVESVAEMSNTSSIVFSISDVRQERQFDVKVEFNTLTCSELKNGMSARMWVYK